MGRGRVRRGAARRLPRRAAQGAFRARLGPPGPQLGSREGGGGSPADPGSPACPTSRPPSTPTPDAHPPASPLCPRPAPRPPPRLSAGPIFEAIQKVSGAAPYTDKIGHEDVGSKDMAYRVVGTSYLCSIFAVFMRLKEMEGTGVGVEGHSMVGAGACVGSRKLGGERGGSGGTPRGEQEQLHEHCTLVGLRKGWGGELVGEGGWVGGLIWCGSNDLGTRWDTMGAAWRYEA